MKKTYLAALLLFVMVAFIACSVNTGPVSPESSGSKYGGKAIDTATPYPGDPPPEEPFDPTELCGGRADGYSTGFWKNECLKAIEDRRNGRHFDTPTLEQYLSDINSFSEVFSEVFSLGSLQDAYDILASRNRDTLSKLLKQLLAAEFNYANEAYINGDEELTLAFIQWGEWIVINHEEYTDDELQYAEDWFEAYNTSHGELFYGPDC